MLGKTCQAVRLETAGRGRTKNASPWRKYGKRRNRLGVIGSADSRSHLAHCGRSKIVV
jgi:hypothetical protein